MIKKIRDCFEKNRLYYSQHAREEMRTEELGIIYETEVYQAIKIGKVIEEYLDDEPYPSFLVLGITDNKRPLHIVCAYSSELNLCFVVTVYEPDPKLWINFKLRRRK